MHMSHGDFKPDNFMIGKVDDENAYQHIQIIGKHFCETLSLLCEIH